MFYKRRKSLPFSARVKFLNLITFYQNMVPNQALNRLLTKVTTCAWTRRSLVSIKKILKYGHVVPIAFV